MKIAILGAGAMGSLVGAHLKKGGAEVYFIDIFKEHMDAISIRGLYMELENEPEPQTVFVDGAVTKGSVVGVCDVVIVLVKCVDIAAAVEENTALFGKNTVVLALQNGLGSEDILADYFAGDLLGVGLLKSSANITAPGKIIGRTCFADSTKGVYFSPVNPGTAYRHVFDNIEKFLCKGGMPAAHSERIEQLRWEKLCDNVMHNGIAALLHLAIEDTSGHEDGRSLMNELARETCEVARAKGIYLDMDHFVQDIADKPPYDRSSVKNFHYVSALFDSIHSRKTEIDYISGAVVREGKKHGIPTPYNETIWRLIRVMQDNYENKFPGNNQLWGK